jgi:hypothetical protein
MTDKTLAEIIERVQGMCFLYEHHTPKDLGSDVVCLMCKDVVKVGSPCKEGTHYPCWCQLQEILSYLNSLKKEGEK